MSDDPLGMKEREELGALGFEIPDSVTPIVAYRSWKLAPGRKFLMSHNQTVWNPGIPLQARCAYSHPRHKDDKSVPTEACSCGIYAAKKEDADVIVPTNPLYVYGAVYLWGKILEGARGFRAEFAYPKELYVVHPQFKEMLEKANYGVPIIHVTPGDALGGYHCFPFPDANRTILPRLRLRQLIPMLAGLPALVVGVVDLFTLNLSQWFNILMVSLLLLVGLLSSALHLVLGWRRRRLEMRLFFKLK